MPFKSVRAAGLWRSYPLRLGVLAIGWFVLISALHVHLNSEHEQRKVVKMGYMPVITNLAAPLLDAASLHGTSPIRFRAVKFASFAEMAEALRNNKIQAAFIIAPLSIVLRQQGEDVKVVYIGNRHESTLVARKGLNIHRVQDLVGHTVAVPMRYSGHNLELLQLVNDAGIADRVRIVEMNPPDMASALATGSLDAYFVGEPFAAQTLKTKAANLVFYVEKVWPGFICNLLLVRQQFIESDSAAVQELVQGAARSGLWAQKNRSQAVRIAARYWGQPVDLVDYAINTPPDRIVFNRFVPIQEEIQHIADMMLRFGLLKKADIEGLIDDRFARTADLTAISDLSSILSVSSSK